MSSNPASLQFEVPDWVFDCHADTTTQREFYVTKGLGSGGTYGGAIWFYLHMLRNPRSKAFWAIAPTYQQVRDTLIPTFATILNENFGLEEFKDFEIMIGNRPRIIFFKTGQSIDFKSANNPKMFVGPSIAGIFGTEPGLWDKEVFEKSSARLRCPRAFTLQAMFEGTPEGIDNEYHRRANFPEGLNEKENRVRVVLWTEHNRHIGADYVTRLRNTYGYDSAKLNSYLYGSFVPFTKGTAYWNFAESRNVKSDLVKDKQLPIILTWDFGINPLTWVGMQKRLCQRRDRSSYFRFEALDESSGKSKGLQDACAEFIQAYPPHEFRDVPIEVYGDASGFAGEYLVEGCSYDWILRWLTPYYTSIKICATRKAPLIKDRLERVNALFSYEQYVISTNCPNLIKSHTLTGLKPGTWELQKPTNKDYTHPSDATGYPLYQLTRTEDLEPSGRVRKLGHNLT